MSRGDTCDTDTLPLTHESMCDEAVGVQETRGAHDGGLSWPVGLGEGFALSRAGQRDQHMQRLCRDRKQGELGGLWLK